MSVESIPIPSLKKKPSAATPQMHPLDGQVERWLKQLGVDAAEAEAIAPAKPFEEFPVERYPDKRLPPYFVPLEPFDREAASAVGRNLGMTAEPPSRIKFSSAPKTSSATRAEAAAAEIQVAQL